MTLTLFDAICVPLGRNPSWRICVHGSLIREACKPTAASGDAVEFVQQAGALHGIQLVINSSDTKPVVAKGVVKFHAITELKNFVTEDFISLFANEISKRRAGNDLRSLQRWVLKLR